MADITSTLRRLFELDDHPLVAVGEAQPLPSSGAAKVSELGFATARGEPVRGLWCQPARHAAPWPAVLVIHAHGARYDIGADELLRGRPALQSPLGPVLAERGIASLCLDMPCFGRRATRSESHAAKACLWEGRSLAGQMLGESRSALDWLAANPRVRPDRIGLFGISMGATLGYWLAALDPRIRALAQDCCLADFRALIETGAHDLHGIYLTIPGLLGLASNGALAGRVAPRPQFIGLGDRDPLTPPPAADRALAELRQAYAQAGGKVTVHREPDAGHEETPAMRAAMLRFFEAELLQEEPHRN
jgi:dienelactone hydrolase